MATIKQVSAHANVSVATVSRVINGSKWVSEDTKARVLKSMDELGYQPNAFAQSLATNRSNIIGLIVGDLSGPFFGDMMHYIESAVRKAGKHLIVTSGHSDLEHERESIQFLLKRRCDALILHLDAVNDEELIQLVETQDTPLVFINRYIPELSDNCIAVENEYGGYLATKFLIEQGHDQLACVVGPQFKADARARMMGFRRALNEHQLPFSDTQIVETEFSEQGGILAVNRLDKREVQYTGLVCGSDQIALGAIRKLESIGRKVPDDVSVIGYDDIVVSSYVEPGLTTIKVPVAEMGEQAAHLALNLAEEPKYAVQNSFTPEVVIRGSVGKRPS